MEGVQNMIRLLNLEDLASGLGQRGLMVGVVAFSASDFMLGHVRGLQACGILGVLVLGALLIAEWRQVDSRLLYYSISIPVVFLITGFAYCFWVPMKGSLGAWFGWQGIIIPLSLGIGVLYGSLEALLRRRIENEFERDEEVLRNTKYDVVAEGERTRRLKAAEKRKGWILGLILVLAVVAELALILFLWLHSGEGP